jgi:hypothetical protein
VTGHSHLEQRRSRGITAQLLERNDRIHPLIVAAKQHPLQKRLWITGGDGRPTHNPTVFRCPGAFDFVVCVLVGRSWAQTRP